MKAVCLLLTVLGFAALAEARSLRQTPPLQKIVFTWKEGKDGIWEDPDNWVPRGYPRSGHHDALICAPGTYKITHTKFLVVGSITFCNDPNVNAQLTLDSTVGYVKGDPNTFVAPRFHVEGNILGKPIRVELTNFQRVFFNEPQIVEIENLSTKDKWNVVLNQTSIYGIYEGWFPTFCSNNSANVPQTNPMTINAAPFDVIEARVTQNGSTWSNFTTMTFVDTYQEKLGLPRVTKTLFARGIEKNLNGLLKLRSKLQWVMKNLPSYDENGCCPDESFTYPLQLFTAAQASYTFLRGYNTPNKTGCTQICDFCNRMNIQFDEGIGPVSFRWTGLGETNSWNDPRNWWPARVPNSPNAVVYLWSANPEYVHLESDVRVNTIVIKGEIKLFNGPYILEVVRSTQRRTARRIWYGQGGSWFNPANWVPYGLPSDQEIAVLAGFGQVDLASSTTIKDLLNIGANRDGDKMLLPNASKVTETDPRPDQFGGNTLDPMNPPSFQ